MSQERETRSGQIRALNESLEQLLSQLENQGIDAAKIRNFIPLDKEEIGVQLALVGKTNSGKSRLLCALLGLDVLPHGLHLQTKFPVRIKTGGASTQMFSRLKMLKPQVQPRIFLADGTVIEVDKNTFKEIATGRSKEEPVGVELFLSASLLNSEIEIIDTPPCSMSGGGLEPEIARVMESADFCLALWDASEPFGEPIRAWLESVKEYWWKIAFVLNKFDRIPRAKRTLVTEEAASSLRTWTDGMEIPVWGVSGKDAFEAVIHHGTAPDIDIEDHNDLDGRFREFTLHVESMVDLKPVMKAVKRAGQLVRVMEAMSDPLEKRFKNHSGSVDRQIHGITEEINALTRLNNERAIHTERWVDGLLDLVCETFDEAIADSREDFENRLEYSFPDFDAVSNLQGRFQDHFRSGVAHTLRLLAGKVRDRIGESLRARFIEFAGSIFKHPDVEPVDFDELCLPDLQCVEEIEFGRGEVELTTELGKPFKVAARSFFSKRKYEDILEELRAEWYSTLDLWEENCHKAFDQVLLRFKEKLDIEISAYMDVCGEQFMQSVDQWAAYRLDPLRSRRTSARTDGAGVLAEFARILSELKRMTERSVFS